MKKQLKYLLFSTLFNITAQQTSGVPTIAVLDFNPIGLSALESQTLTQQFAAEIWNTRNQFGSPVAAGIYFYQIQTRDFVKTKKMVLLK